MTTVNESPPREVSHEPPAHSFRGPNRVKIEDNSGTEVGRVSLPALLTSSNTDPPQIPPSSLAWLEPLSIDTRDEEIQARYERDGVVWLKNVIPREIVLEMRRTYFEFVRASGVLKEGSDAVEGVFGDGDPLKFSEYTY